MPLVPTIFLHAAILCEMLPLQATAMRAADAMSQRRRAARSALDAAPMY